MNNTDKTDEFEECETTNLNEDESKKIKKENNVKDDVKYNRFYEKLKNKFKKKTDGKYNQISDYLFLLPDFFMLLFRLMKDERVEKKQKFFIVGVMAYVISPIDLIPDFIPIIGYVDDLVLVVFAINSLLNEIDIEIVQDNWSGDTAMLQKLKDVSAMADNYLDRNILKKIKNWIFKNRK